MSELDAQAMPPSSLPLSPAEVAASHARHYAALLAQEEEGTAGWQFVFGQLSAASTLTNALRCVTSSGQ